MTTYYIYYRVQPDKQDACASIVRELLAAVRKATGVAGRFMRKRDERHLWMEIYENVTDDAQFEWELADAAGRLKIQEFLLPGSTRHVECFEDTEVRES